MATSECTLKRLTSMNNASWIPNPAADIFYSDFFYSYELKYPCQHDSIEVQTEERPWNGDLIEYMIEDPINDLCNTLYKESTLNESIVFRVTCEECHKDFSIRIYNYQERPFLTIY